MFDVGCRMFDVGCRNLGNDQTLRAKGSPSSAGPGHRTPHPAPRHRPPHPGHRLPRALSRTALALSTGTPLHPRTQHSLETQ
ncbi:MAG: hypothetical protein IPH84_09355 [Bacteroidales bacterium]|nr:hypothetical protein [Bacteroidales bacterium]